MRLRYYDGIFAMATAKWESIIQDGLRSWPDVSNFNSDLFFGNLGATYSGAVDDVVLGYAIEPIDGRGGVLGRVGAARKAGRGDATPWRDLDRPPCTVLGRIAATPRGATWIFQWPPNARNEVDTRAGRSDAQRRKPADRRHHALCGVDIIFEF